MAALIRKIKHHFLVAMVLTAPQFTTFSTNYKWHNGDESEMHCYIVSCTLHTVAVTAANLNESERALRTFAFESGLVAATADECGAKATSVATQTHLKRCNERNDVSMHSISFVHT